jgi:hypothetical protein
MDPEERKELILAGAIEPIIVSAKLEKNEKAYIALKAKRTATIDHQIEVTKGGTKRKGVVTRAVVGSALLAPTGLWWAGGIAGAATAGSKTNSKTQQKTVTKFEIVDTGELIFTDMRVLFIGNKEILSLPYEALIDTKFGRNLLGRTFSPKYEEMLPNETFVISGPAAPEASLYFQGITQNLLR